jgi:hypothetical protein
MRRDTGATGKAQPEQIRVEQVKKLISLILLSLLFE